MPVSKETIKLALEIATVVIGAILDYYKQTKKV